MVQITGQCFVHQTDGEGFQKGSSGAALNYYFTADGDLQPDVLYQFRDIEFNNMMVQQNLNKIRSTERQMMIP